MDLQDKRMQCFVWLPGWAATLMLSWPQRNACSISSKARRRRLPPTAHPSL